MANSVPNFNDGEALDHGDLNNICNVLDNNAALASYARLVANYCHITGSTYATVYAAGLQEIGFDTEPTFTLASGSIGLSPGRRYVGLGLSPQSTDPEDRVIVALDMAAASVVVPANATGSQRTDTLSIPATEATLFAAGTSTARDFKDAVTGALSSQSQNKRYTASTTLTYTAGGSAPANHATIATFTVPNGSSTPTLQYRYWIPMGTPEFKQMLISEIMDAALIASSSITGGANITSTIAPRISLGPFIPKGAFVTDFDLRIESDTSASGTISISTVAANGIPATAFVETNPVTLPALRSAATSTATLAGNDTDFITYSLGPFVHGSIGAGLNACYFLRMDLTATVGDNIRIYDLQISYIPYR